MGTIKAMSIITRTATITTIIMATGMTTTTGTVMVTESKR